ncbi:MAG: transporter substrate-binding domain-containing protein [Parvibaculaceae bacterium]
MTRIVCAILVGVVMLMSGAAAVTAEGRKIRIATEGTYRPMSYYDAAGKLTGFEVELVEAICAKIKADCEWVIMEFDAMTPALQEKKVDGISSGMRITDKRKKVIDFPDKYYSTYAQFVTCSHKDQADTSPAAFKGMVIGTQSGSTNADFLNELYGKDAEIRLYKSMDEVYLDLQAGRLDAALSSAFVGYDFLHSDKGKDCVFLGEKMSDPKYFGYGVSMGLRKGDDELRNMLNEGIKAVQADGTYDKINAKYWPFSVK